MSFKKCKFILRKVATTRLFELLLLRAAPAQEETAWVPVWAKARGRRNVCRSRWTYGDNRMWFKAKNVYLSISKMHRGSESQSQHNITTSMWLFNSLCGHFWILVVSLSQTSFHTHNTEGETTKWSFVWITFEQATSNEEELRKYNPLVEVETMPNQENQVHIVEWAESLVRAQPILT